MCFVTAQNRLRSMFFDRSRKIRCYMHLVKWLFISCNMKIHVQIGYTWCKGSERNYNLVVLTEHIPRQGAISVVLILKFAKHWAINYWLSHQRNILYSLWKLKESLASTELGTRVFSSGLSFTVPLMRTVKNPTTRFCLVLGFELIIKDCRGGS